MASLVIGRYGECLTLVVSSLTYITYVLSVAYIATPVVLVTSMFLGIFGGFLNTAAGSFLAKNSNESNRGSHSGINGR